MSELSVRQRLTTVFSFIMDDPEFEFDEGLSMGDIEAWDSFAQINLMIAIEQEFGIEFESDEIGELTSAKSILDAVTCRPNAS